MTETPEAREVASEPGEITRLLAAWREGESGAFDELLPQIYRDLRALAAARIARENPGHTLQPTALVHEAWMRLAKFDPRSVDSRSHFFAIAAKAMRRILVDHARRRRADKRGGGAARVTLDPERSADEERDPEILDVHRALKDLELVSERQAQLVELRYFGGLTLPEIAEIQGTSVATAKRDWTAARVWLRRRLGSLGDGDGPYADDGGGD